MKKSRVLALLAAVGLLVGAAADRLSLPRPSDALSYHQRVRDVAAGLPSRAGDWIATELPPPPEAIEQLRPNVLVYRSYRNVQTRRTVSFMLVQCGDVRDRVAHYPPVCYPGRGLRLTSATQSVVALGERPVPVTRYEFESNHFARSAQVCVDNFMILPDGRMKPDMQGMEREIGLSNRFFGAAQVQVVSEGTVPAQERDEAFTQIVGAYEPLIGAVAGGVSNE